MIGSFSVSDLYLATNSSAPEKAIWAMYFSTSSSVIPIPVSAIEIVLRLLSILTEILKSVSWTARAPPSLRIRILFRASVAFEMSSRIKMSLSE